MNKLRFILISVLSAVFLLISCAEPVPVKEMARAKNSISLAKRFKADVYSADQYRAAQDKLLASHTSVKDGKHDVARAEAKEADELAKQAYTVSAPRVINEQLTIAQQSLEAAREANAQVFAPEEYRTAEQRLSQARSDLNAGDFASAMNYAVAADDSAKDARTISLGKKQIVFDAISEVRQTLATAQQYNAERLAPTEYQTGTTKLNESVEAYQVDKLKVSYDAVQIAKTNADAALAKVIANAAQDNLARADAEVARAASSAGAEIATDELSAAREMAARARTQYNEESYRESLTSSNEAIRLAGLVVQAGRDAQASLAGNGGSSPQVVGVEEGNEDYVIYRVRYFRNGPKDCLRFIAKRYYGDEMKWPIIYRANQELIRNPDLIYPEWRLRIPRLERLNQSEQETVTPAADAAASSSEAPADAASAADEALPATSEGEEAPVTDDSVTDDSYNASGDYDMPEESTVEITPEAE